MRIIMYNLTMVLGFYGFLRRYVIRILYNALNTEVTDISVL